MKKKSVHILVDSGSTHNFLDEEFAKSLLCDLVKITPLKVTVADGNHILVHIGVKILSGLWLMITFSKLMLCVFLF